MAIRINDTLELADEELEFSAVRAQGAGGQHVNKTACAACLRFDIGPSSLPDAVKARLLRLRDRRISADGVIVIKAQASRSLEQNRRQAIARLVELLQAAARVERPRKPTRPSLAAKRRRLDSKNRRGQIKASRARIEPDE